MITTVINKSFKSSILYNGNLWIEDSFIIHSLVEACVTHNLVYRALKTLKPQTPRPPPPKNDIPNKKNTKQKKVGNNQKVLGFNNVTPREYVFCSSSSFIAWNRKKVLYAKIKQFFFFFFWCFGGWKWRLWDKTDRQPAADGCRVGVSELIPPAASFWQHACLLGTGGAGKSLPHPSPPPPPLPPLLFLLHFCLVDTPHFYLEQVPKLSTLSPHFISFVSILNLNYTLYTWRKMIGWCSPRATLAFGGMDVDYVGGIAFKYLMPFKLKGRE